MGFDSPGQPTLLRPARPEREVSSSGMITDVGRHKPFIFGSSRPMLSREVTKSPRKVYLVGVVRPTPLLLAGLH
jgi:hypothetical protein